jgi:hypothetical protein
MSSGWAARGQSQPRSYRAFDLSIELCFGHRIYGCNAKGGPRDSIWPPSNRMRSALRSCKNRANIEEAQVVVKEKLGEKLLPEPEKNGKDGMLKIGQVALRYGGHLTHYVAGMTWCYARSIVPGRSYLSTGPVPRCPSTVRRQAKVHQASLFVAVLGANLVFADESGFQLIPNLARTCTPEGQVPFSPPFL